MIGWTDGRVVAVLVVAAVAVIVALPRSAPVGTVDGAGAADAAVGSATWALEVLGDLATGDGTAPVPYDRSEYDDGWADDDGDCRNTRHEVLVAESLVGVEFIDAERCRVASGRWIDPYTGLAMTEASEASIDHVVSLADAHRSGAWRWSLATKRAFANDLDDPAPLAVADPGVNSRKGSTAPDSWLPEGDESRCAYAVAWVRTKARWLLSVTADERSALEYELERCAAAGLPDTRETTPLVSAVIVLTDDVESKSEECDVRYESVCIPLSTADLDCPDVTPRSFTVTTDPHRFDGDDNGIACE